jgi:hypothetical protein
MMRRDDARCSKRKRKGDAAVSNAGQPNTHATSGEAAAGTSEPAHASPLVCAKCGYALDGLKGLSLCPECGYDIELSRQHHDDRAGARALRASVVGACRMIAVASFTMVLVLFSAAAGSLAGAGGATQRFLVIPLLMATIGSIIAALGYVRLAKKPLIPDLIRERVRVRWIVVAISYVQLFSYLLWLLWIAKITYAPRLTNVQSLDDAIQEVTGMFLLLVVAPLSIARWFFAQRLYKFIAECAGLPKITRHAFWTTLSPLLVGLIVATFAMLTVVVSSAIVSFALATCIFAIPCANAVAWWVLARGVAKRRR